MNPRPVPPVDFADPRVARGAAPQPVPVGASDASWTSPGTADVAGGTEERHGLASRILIDALLLGALGDALLRAPVWGANMTVWAVAIITAAVLLARRRADPFPASARRLLIPAVGLALLLSWRETNSLAAYNVLALLATIGLLSIALARGPELEVARLTVREVVVGAVGVGLGSLFGMLPLALSDLSLRRIGDGRAGARALVTLRAVLIAIPLLLLFGGLFASADPVFARLAGEVLRIDPEAIASHLVVSGVVAWLVGGFLRTTLLSDRLTTSVRMFDGAFGLPEVATALGSLVLLFGAFVAVQVRYFFGGDALVQQTAGMSYAEYARHGFFELVVVTALVVPVLLSANALLRRESPHADGVFTALSSALLSLLAVIMYSALARMWLYQSVYGLSLDRLYATVFMGWLALVLGWFAATVLRGHSSRFLGGVLVTGWTTLFALNVFDPGRFVAERNIARAKAGASLDVAHLASVGADAAPPLVTYLVGAPLEPPRGWASGAPEALAADSASADGFTARCQAARTLLSRWGEGTGTDWRGWTLGAAGARRAVAANARALRTLASNAGSGVPCPAPAEPAATRQPASAAPSTR